MHLRSKGNRHTLNATSIALLFALVFSNCSVGSATCLSKSHEEFLHLSLTVDILKNGSAVVSWNMSGWINHPFNLSIPKTAESYAYYGDIDLAQFVETSVSFDYLQLKPTANEKVNILVECFWPDCAAAFNNSYYVSANELLPLYPSKTRVQSNVTVIFPENSILLDRWCLTNRTISNRLYVSFIANGHKDIDECREYLPLFKFTQTEHQENISEKCSEHIRLSYPEALGKWANTVFLYSNLAYDRLNSLWGTRTSGRVLTINLVPSAYIEERMGPLPIAFYSPKEDAIYFPAHWTIGASYSLFNPLHVLFHEICHGFTSHYLPIFLSEGLSEFAAFRLFDLLGLEEDKGIMLTRTYLENPLEDPDFNATEFFGWGCEGISRAHAFFVVYDLINFTGVSAFRDFLRLFEKKQVRIRLSQSQDRYDLLASYLNIVCHKNTGIFFEKYGLHTNPDRLFLSRNLSIVLFGFDVLLLMVLSWRASKWHSQRKIKRFTLSICIISSGGTTSFLFFLSSWHIENFLSPHVLLIGFGIFGFLLVASIASLSNSIVGLASRLKCR